MVAKLEGGCVVTDLREGEVRGDKVSLRGIKVRGERTLFNESAEEVLYVIDGRGTADGREIAVDSGIYLPPQTSLELKGDVTLVSVLCGAPAPSPVRAGGGAGAPLRHVQLTSLNDQPLQRTGDRSYRELIQQQVTQFVGTIPPGRAPNHHH